MQEQYTARYSPGRMSAKTARALLAAEFGNQCLRCRVVPGPNEIPLAVDHIVPVARGGQDVYPNYQLLCTPCNLWKHMRVIDFRPGTQSLDLLAEREVIPLQERTRRAWQPSAQRPTVTKRVTIREAAIQLSVSESTIRRMIRDGLLDAETYSRPGGTFTRVDIQVPEEPVEDGSTPSEPPVTQAPDASQDVALALVDRLATQDAMIAESAERERAQADRIAALEREIGRRESEATHAAELARIERERRLEADKRAAAAEALAAARAAELERLLRRPWWRRILD